MNTKSKQKLILCGLITMATAFYNSVTKSTTSESSNYVESSNEKDFDLLGTKIFAPKKTNKLSDEVALEHYLSQNN